MPCFRRFFDQNQKNKNIFEKTIEILF